MIKISARFLIFSIAALVLLTSCSKKEEKRIMPKVLTGPVLGDADDPAIWIHPTDRSLSVIIGNDKKENGALYVWDLSGKQLYKTDPLNRPVNIDVRYGMSLGDDKCDIAVCGISGNNTLKVYKIDPATRALVDITTLDGIATGFDKDSYGLSLYQNPNTGKIYVFVSQKLKGAPINQILLEPDGKGRVKGTFVRSFKGSDQHSYVEGMCADDELGYLYCSDEQHAILKYFADPEKESGLVSSFALGDGIAGDREGLALYQCPGGQGYLILSSQGNSALKIYERSGNNKFVKTVYKSGSTKTDGVVATSCAAGPFPYGFVVCHNDALANFVLYSWEDIAKEELMKCTCQSR